MKVEVVSKAYELNLSAIDEGYMCSEVIVHAETKGKAKSALWSKICSDNYQKTNGDDVSFINMPIRRSPRYDLVNFEGNTVVRNEIDSILAERKRGEYFEAILKDSTITHCYIRKGAYYRPDYCGYTDFQHRAGVYTKEDAIAHARGISEIRIEPIDNYKHNQMILNEINELKTRIIQYP